MTSELAQHPRVILEVIVAYWAFSAVVSGMPEAPAGSFWYKWLYSTLHMFAGNLKTFADQRIAAVMTTTKTVEVQGAVAASEVKAGE